MLIFFVVIITACGHVFTEYTLQRTRLGILKRKRIIGLILHASLWTMAICPGLIILGVFAPWKFVFLLSTHTIIDFVKMKLITGRIGTTHPANITDQTLHLLTIIIAYIS